MNKRQAKRLIPKDTLYCYKILGREENTFKIKSCPHKKFIKYVDDEYEVKGVLFPTLTAIYVCKFTGINTDEDASLFDDCKVCGVSYGLY